MNTDINAINMELIYLEAKVHELNDRIHCIKDHRIRQGVILNDEDRKEYDLISKRLNNLRSYVVYLSKELDHEKQHFEDEVKYYDHFLKES